ncbi:MAG: toxin-antitoxin system HicB family antitoxin, partial [Blastocatellia bacterium]
MKFGEYDAVISFDPEIQMFRGEFSGLNGGADFYADSIENLRK